MHSVKVLLQSLTLDDVLNLSNDPVALLLHALLQLFKSSGHVFLHRQARGSMKQCAMRHL